MDRNDNHLPKTKRVLIAEDSVVLGDVIRFNFQRAGCEPTLARNGREALERLSSEPFDLLLSDYEMPEVDGAELCRRVRDELFLTEIPIILCTAKCLEINQAQLKAKYSLAAILCKPFSMRDLTALALRIINSDMIENSSPDHRFVPSN